MIIGILIDFGAFCYSVLNMAGMFDSKGIGVDCTHQGEPLSHNDHLWESRFQRHSDFSQSFRRHTLVMIPMAFGGLVAFAGLVLIAIHFVPKLGAM